MNILKERKLKPKKVHAPETLKGLTELLARKPELTIVGGGVHVRSSDVNKKEVVSTLGCDRVINVDRISHLIRVETGLTWGAFKQVLRDHGMSVSRFALYPDPATIGGLLARKQVVPRALWDGDIRTQCTALSVALPNGEYRYLAAPRKSSGPDLRYAFFGSEGRLGFIRDATLAVWPKSDGLLLTYEGPAEEISRRMHALLHLGVRVSWSFAQGQKNDGIVSVSVHGTDRLLKTIRTHVADWFEIEPYDNHRDDLESDLSLGHYPATPIAIRSSEFERTVSAMPSWICTHFSLQSATLLSKPKSVKFKPAQWYEEFSWEPPLEPSSDRRGENR